MGSLSRNVAIFLSGLIWVCVGIFLLYKGVGYLQGASAYWLALIALLLGLAKGAFVLGKSAKRSLRRLALFKGTIPLLKLYSRGNYILILSMMAIGMLFRFLPISIALKAFIDIAVGTALVTGSLFFFRKKASYL